MPLNARVVEWQTRQLEVLVGETPCRFDSCPEHQFQSLAGYFRSDISNDRAWIKTSHLEWNPCSSSKNSQSSIDPASIALVGTFSNLKFLDLKWKYYVSLPATPTSSKKSKPYSSCLWTTEWVSEFISVLLFLKCHVSSYADYAMEGSCRC